MYKLTLRKPPPFHPPRAFQLWSPTIRGRVLGHLRPSENAQGDKIDEVGSFTETRRSGKLKRIVARSKTDRFVGLNELL